MQLEGVTRGLNNITKTYELYSSPEDEPCDTKHVGLFQ
jgi:hypothetical protein